MAIGFFTLEYLISVAPHFRLSTPRSVLELGESEALFFDLASYLDRISAASGRARGQLERELAEARTGPPEQIPTAEARLIYSWLLGMTSYRAVDLGSPRPECWIDLNYPANLGRQYETVINNGTSEHIFNQANVFQFIHDHTALGGMMVHYTCGLGWVEHGFYNVQPSFFFDLAKYNGYEVLSCNLVNETTVLPLEAGKINGDNLNADPRLRNALIHCCLRRCDAAPFRYPIQGPYQPGR